MVKSLPPKAPPELINLQSWFAKAVLAAPGTPNPAFAQADQFLTASKTQTAKERLTVYINDYWPRCIDSLREDFSALEKFWGVKKFEGWMTRYLSQFPSTSFTLFHLPQNLYTFVAENYKEDDRTIVLDILRLEYAVARAYFETEGRPFNPKILNPTQRAQISTVRFKFQPHLQFLSLDYAVRAFVESPTLTTKPKQQPEYLAVFRQNLQVTVEPLEPLQFKLLDALSKGESLVGALELLEPEIRLSSATISEKDIQSWFEKCVAFGWIIHPK